MTRSSLSTSSGVPRATTAPWFEGEQLVGDRGDQRHVVLDDEDAAARLEPHPPQQRAEPLGLGLGDARRRLVEQQHLRLGGQHAGQVDDAAQTGRQLLDELVAEGAELEQLDEPLGPQRAAGARRGGTAAAPTARAACSAHLEPLLERDEQRLEDGERREQPGVLEAADQLAPGRAARAAGRDVDAVEARPCRRRRPGSREMMSNSVVLPEPLGPMRPSTSPSRSAKLDVVDGA